MEKFSSSPVELDESEEKPAREYNIPDASSISAFMTQVADLIEYVIFFLAVQNSGNRKKVK